MKTAEDLLAEISAASRRTRDAALLGLLGDIKAFLESPPPPTRASPLDDHQAGRLPPREVQLRKNNYMREWMRRKRKKDRDAKNAIINSIPKDSSRTDRDSGGDDAGKTQAGAPSPEDGKS